MSRQCRSSRRRAAERKATYRPLLRLIALLVPLLLCAEPALAATVSGRSPAVHGSQDAQVPTRPPTEVILDKVGPKVVRPSSTLQVTGRLTNKSTSSYRDVSVRLRYGATPIISRGRLDLYVRGRSADPPRYGPTARVGATLAVGVTRPWSLKLSVEKMGLRRFGVYPILVEAYDATGRVIGRQRTLITYYPKSKGLRPEPTRIAWVWPIVDQPHRASDATFVDDRLEDELAADGRLGGLVRAAERAKTPVSWLVDPSVVDDAAHMANADGYSVADEGHHPRSRTAAHWLAELRAAIGDEQVIATPYADPDIMALTHAKMTEDIANAVAMGARVARRKDALNMTVTNSVALPPDGAADGATLRALADNGVRTVLLSSADLPPTTNPTYTPDPVARLHVPGGGTMTGVAYDATINRLLGDDTRRPGQTILAEQRFLAETAMITAELPKHSRTIVAVPPSRWDPAPQFAERLLTYSSKVPWLKPVELDKATATEPTPRALVHSSAAAGRELSAAHLERVDRLDDRIKRFAAALRPQVSVLEAGILRTESAAWRGRSERAVMLRQELSHELTAAVGKVSVINHQVSLAGKSGLVPVTIANDLGSGTVTVRLRATSQNSSRLKVGDYEREVTIEAGHKDTIKIPMKSAANGVTVVDLELLTPDGKRLGEPRRLRVRTTGYGRTALVITGCSLAVLFLGIGIRVMRRTRRRDGAEEPRDGPGDPGTDAGGVDTGATHPL